MVAAIASNYDFFSYDTGTIEIKPHIGLVNGLYATTVGLGGITIIEVLKNHSAQSLSLHLTGMQGDVMKESMNVAKTLAWNLIRNDLQLK